MKCVLLVIAAVIGLFALGESLKCNKCSVALVGICLNPSTTECSTNTSQCITSRASFPSISGFLGFNSQGCAESSNCTGNITGFILGAKYEITQTCCKTDRCNPVQLNGASYIQLSLTAVLSATLFACVWGQSVY
ncbi:lymphocyte antigen-6, epidermis [Neoarius graeffei]|uniref:lymphocyte antigen-6, epidermis n=1 Tax=Neoarius graeffei TaxID=443677 RepID=UPI00298D0D08|nr:lymphocyte antigen-6, epidermis [Neoarius graeffei]